MIAHLEFMSYNQCCITITPGAAGITEHTLTQATLISALSDKDDGSRDAVTVTLDPEAAEN